MKYKFTIFLGISFGTVMSVLWGTVFSNLLGASGMGIGIALGASFACCGCLFGYGIDKKGEKKDKDEENDSRK